MEITLNTENRQLVVINASMIEKEGLDQCVEALHHLQLRWTPSTKIKFMISGSIANLIEFSKYCELTIKVI